VLSKGSLPTPRLMDRFDSAGRQVKRLAELVERLLDVSRIAGGRLNLNKAPMDLARTVREVADDFREPAHQAGIALTVNASDEVQGVWDRARIEQVIVNLLANALKYGNGRPVEVCVDRRDGLARVLVKDHGIGVSREDAERIFGRFERAVPISNYGGLGLGLYITRHIVDAHGGIIRVESEPGAGATFIVELPT
jgi:signal transduction histidine kinase